MLETTTPHVLALHEWLVVEQVMFGRHGAHRRVLKADRRPGLYYLAEHMVECRQNVHGGNLQTRQYRGG